MRPPTSAFSLLLGISLLSLPGVLAAPPAEGPLEGFLPSAETAARLQPVLDQLESESFAERQAASGKLAALPALPGFIRQLAATETRPESRQRLRDLAAAFPIEKENDRLTGILQQLVKDATKGQLDALCRVMRGGLWTPANDTLYDAARATVIQADLPLLERCVKDPAPVFRRIAATAFGGLPAADSTIPLVGLLGDDDAETAILAAMELAARQDRRALAAFARLLDSPDFQVRHRCHGALLGLTKQDFGYDPGADQAEREVPAGKWRDWAGSAAAAITGTAPKDSSIALFNGRNLDGWEFRAGNVLFDKSDVWEAVRGELQCTGKRPVAPSPDLWTKTGFENYILTLEYRAEAKDSDSGVGLLLTKAGEQGAQAPRYLEVQLLPGNVGDLYQIGGVQVEANGKPINFQSPRLAQVKDPARTWHRLKLTVRDGTVEVAFDGVVVNRTSKGPRGPGRIVLRNEGYAIAFRNLLLFPLPAAPEAADKPDR